MALDGYNWGTSGVGVNQWQSLSQVFSSSYRQLTQLSTKPVIIAETSSSEIGGDKAAWIRDGFLRTIPQQFPRVRAVIWFDRSMEQDWRVDSSQASLDAYRDVASSSLYGGPDPAPSVAKRRGDRSEASGGALGGGRGDSAAAEGRLPAVPGGPASRSASAVASSQAPQR